MKKNGRLERGDFIRLRSQSGGDWETGLVAIASDTDPQSLVVILFQSPQQGFSIGLPLTISYAGETVENLVTHEQYDVEVPEEAGLSGPPDEVSA